MRYGRINLFDIANGEGIRVSLFVSGCNFHCKECFNQAAQSFDYGDEYTEKTLNLILNRLKNPDFDGVSLLGGDPLWQDEDGLRQLTYLAQTVHLMGKTVWLWSGYKFEDVAFNLCADNLLKRLLVKNCDVFVDGQFIAEQKDLSLAWRGSSNQRIIDVQKSFDAGEAVLKELRS